MQYDLSFQTISWFNGRRNDGSLIISPKFQRRPVWLRRERSALIQTVCEQLPFPEIYLQITTDPATGLQSHIVVDGQQRITSLLMFIDGEVDLPDSHPWGGRSFRDLTEEEQVAFWDYKIVVRALRSTSDAEIRELFTRLNTNNVALNDQELRNARYHGRFAAAVERLADEPFFQAIGLFSAREIRRMLDVEFVSELLVRVVEGIINKKDLLEGAYASYDEEFPGEAEYENEFAAAIALLRSVVRPENQSLVRTKSNFYSLFGACLRYYREEARASFRAADIIAQGITDLLLQVRAGATPDSPAVIGEYFEAVSRASSDKGRREIREEILYSVIMTGDEGGLDTAGDRRRGAVT